MSKITKTYNASFTFTYAIPICPYCQVSTIREEEYSMQTNVYCPPIYDENGKNINPDRNSTVKNYHCRKCNKDYSIVGNYVNGWEYRKG